MGNYRIIDHTADIGIEIEAEGVKELFEETVDALLFVLTELKPEEIKKSIKQFTTIREKIVIKKGALENVILDLLNRIIFLVDARKLIPVSIHQKERRKVYRFLIHMINEPSLLKREIKAATYHNLKIIKESGMYRVKIIFDI